jgi:hypothetical protein
MHSMASSSSSPHKSLQDYKLKAEEDEGGDWLELGLGFGKGCRKAEENRSNDPVSVNPLPSASSSSSPLQTSSQQIGLGLGLGLRFDNDDGIRHVGVLPPSTCNYHNLLWPDHYHHYDDHHHNGMPSSWPWHIDSGGAFLGLHDWQMPVPDDTHHDYFSTRRPQSSGLWFTLRSLTNR